MDNSTEAPEDEYDVLIDGDLQSSEPPPCDMDAAKVLSPHLLQPLFFTVFTLGLLDNILLVLILDCQSSHHLHASVQITKVIATSHGCVPPLLCVILHKPIRKYLSHLFHPSWCTPRRAGEDAGQAPLRSLTTYL
ncbi:C-C chemokine receptor-like 2 isoform X2 [Ochotona curzoniae]|uniref:C-C chemokine receptor-like 2 isoform X2 n=1 Tax=Ochotona curzoniae TaxID=130825 RepID=UPI001B345893|nr:C-C chemokine receptor-like 2 isoform X2 [Ochotona curzoniae]